MKARETRIVRGADHVICVTEAVRDLLANTYQVKPAICTVIPNGADTDLFRPRPREACRRSIGEKPEAFIIGFVGAFQPWVDFPAVLEATRLLIESGVEMKLLLVGDGQRDDEVRRRVSSLGLDGHVLLPGRVPHHDVATWIGAMDVALVPFDFSGRGFEGSPLKLFEYMACGRAVVGTDLPGTAEFIRAGNAGVLYPVGDAAGLTEQIRRLHDDETLRLQLGRNGHDYATRHHSWAAVAEQTESIALELLAEREMA
jgi:glycosyltransferase involved in cell wall biosynthesis